MSEPGFSQNGKLATHGFIVAVEVGGEAITIDALMDKLGDALRFVDGVGQVEIEHLGELDIIEGINVTIKDTETLEDFPPMVRES